MAGLSIVSLLLMLVVCHASPITTSKRHDTELIPRAERQCDIQNIKVYQDIYDCEKKSHLGPDGHCDGKMPKPDDVGACASYCEVKVYYSYGREVPYPDACEANECTVKQGRTTTVTNTWEINANVGFEVSKSSLLGAFNIGSSYSYSVSVSYTIEREEKELLDDGECGYWTRVPVFVTSCGTLTTTTSHDTSALGAPATCNMDEQKEVHNWCNTTPATSADGSAFGKNIFVYTKCDGLGGIDWNHPGQSDTYLQPGVSSAQDAPQPPTVEPPPVEEIDLSSLFPSIGILHPRR